MFQSRPQKKLTVGDAIDKLQGTETREQVYRILNAALEQNAHIGNRALNEKGQTPYMRAVLHKHPNIHVAEWLEDSDEHRKHGRLLRKTNPTLAAKDQAGNTALMYAVQFADDEEEKKVEERSELGIRRQFVDRIINKIYKDDEQSGPNYKVLTKNEAISDTLKTAITHDNRWFIEKYSNHAWDGEFMLQLAVEHNKPKILSDICKRRNRPSLTSELSYDILKNHLARKLSTQQAREMVMILDKDFSDDLDRFIPYRNTAAQEGAADITLLIYKIVALYFKLPECGDLLRRHLFARNWVYNFSTDTIRVITKLPTEIAADLVEKYNKQEVNIDRIREILRIIIPLIKKKGRHHQPDQFQYYDDESPEYFNFCKTAIRFFTFDIVMLLIDEFIKANAVSYIGKLLCVLIEAANEHNDPELIGLKHYLTALHNLIHKKPVEPQLVASQEVRVALSAFIEKYGHLQYFQQAKLDCLMAMNNYLKEVQPEEKVSEPESDLAEYAILFNLIMNSKEPSDIPKIPSEFMQTLDNFFRKNREHFTIATMNYLAAVNEQLKRSQLEEKRGEQANLTAFADILDQIINSKQPSDILHVPQKFMNTLDNFFAQYGQHFTRAKINYLTVANKQLEQNLDEIGEPEPEGIVPEKNEAQVEGRQNIFAEEKEQLAAPAKYEEKEQLTVPAIYEEKEQLTVPANVEDEDPGIEYAPTFYVANPLVQTLFVQPQKSKEKNGEEDDAEFIQEMQKRLQQLEEPGMGETPEEKELVQPRAMGAS